MLETRFRFSMSERRSGACACAVDDDEAAATAPGPDASDAEDVSRELLGDNKRCMLVLLITSVRIHPKTLKHEGALKI